MDWEPFGQDISVGGKPAEVRSLRLPDDLGNLRRCRVATTWNLARPGFTRTPAYARLAREKTGLIGAVVLGRHGGCLKIGCSPASQHFLFVPLNSLSKKPRAALLKDRTFDLFTEGNLLFGREEKEF